MLPTINLQMMLCESFLLKNHLSHIPATVLVRITLPETGADVASEAHGIARVATLRSVIPVT